MGKFKSCFDFTIFIKSACVDFWLNGMSVWIWDVIMFLCNDYIKMIEFVCIGSYIFVVYVI